MLPVCTYCLAIEWKTSTCSGVTGSMVPKRASSVDFLRFSAVLLSDVTLFAVHLCVVWCCSVGLLLLSKLLPSR